MPTNLLLGIFFISLGGTLGILWDHFRSLRSHQRQKIAEVMEKEALSPEAPEESKAKGKKTKKKEDDSEEKTLARQKHEHGESSSKTDDKEILSHKDIGALLRRAELFLARKDFTEAEKLFIKILAFDENHSMATQKLAYLYLQMEAYPKAETLYRQLSEKNSSDPGIYTNLGLALFHQKKFPEAITTYEKAIALEPDRGARYANLGQVLFVMKDLDAAIECFRKAVGKEPRNVGFLYLLADACQEGKHFVEAKKWYEKILDLSPYDTDAKEEVRRLKALGF